MCANGSRDHSFALQPEFPHPGAACRFVERLHGEGGLGAAVVAVLRVKPAGAVVQKVEIIGGIVGRRAAALHVPHLFALQTKSQAGLTRRHTLFDEPELPAGRFLVLYAQEPLARAGIGQQQAVVSHLAGGKPDLVSGLLGGQRESGQQREKKQDVLHDAEGLEGFGGV